MIDELRAFITARLDEEDLTGATRSELRLHQARRALVARDDVDVDALLALAREWQNHPDYDPAWDNQA
jgi:hypothetical protein